MAMRLVENTILKTNNNNNIIVSHHILCCLMFCDISFDIFGVGTTFLIFLFGDRRGRGLVMFVYHHHMVLNLFLA